MDRAPCGSMWPPGPHLAAPSSLLGAARLPERDSVRACIALSDVEFELWAVRCWHSCQVGAVGATSLETLKAGFDGALGSLS